MHLKMDDKHLKLVMCNSTLSPNTNKSQWIEHDDDGDDDDNDDDDDNVWMFTFIICSIPCSSSASVMS